MELRRFDGKVAIVTGSGGGLGASHAKLLARLGAAVVVNDIGGSLAGTGRDAGPAQRVAQAITAAGGRAVANCDSVEDGERIVECALDSFGRIDIVINNAGNLRDRAFHNMSVEEWDHAYRVHLLGSFRVTRAAWPNLRNQGYGRVIFTSSVAGLFGNFGQANYSAMKMAVLGLCRTLAVEGAGKGILVNAISPSAASRMSGTIVSPKVNASLRPELVSGLVAFLCHDSCNSNGRIFAVGAGWAAEVRLAQGEGAYLGDGAGDIDQIAHAWQDITRFDAPVHPNGLAEAVSPIVQLIPELKALFGGPSS